MGNIKFIVACFPLFSQVRKMVKGFFGKCCPCCRDKEKEED